MIATKRFAGLARQAARGFGLAGARIAAVPHPIGGSDPALLRRWAAAALDEVIGLLSPREV